jgi:hypothetical protein
MIQIRHELAKVISADAGGEIDCGCWWLIVERRKCKVNQPVTYLKWHGRRFRASLVGLQVVHGQAVFCNLI